MFNEFEFFGHVYPISYDGVFPLIEVQHIALAPVLGKQLKKSESFRRFEGVFFCTKNETVFFDFKSEECEMSPKVLF